MAETKNQKATKKMAEIWKEVFENRAFVPTSKKILGSSSFEKTSSTEKAWIIKRDYVLVDPKLLITLTSGELKIVCQIISELKKYNALWYFDYRAVGGKTARVISQLRAKEILFKTDELSMHIVNPLKISRGSIEVVVAATTSLIADSKQIDQKLFKHLKSPDKANPNPFFTLQM